MRNALRLWIAVFAIIAQLCGCASTQHTTPAPFLPFTAHRPPPNPIIGVYVGQNVGMNVLEYQYQGTGSPLCTLSLSSPVTSIQSDSKNELIVPEFTGANIYKEHTQLCLSGLPSKQFPQVTSGTDGFSVNGTTYYFDEYTDIAVCVWGKTPKCPRKLTNPNAWHIFGVTATSSGVYASGINMLGGATLVYWQGAKEPGTVLNGFVNNTSGGIYFDGLGNLLSIDPARPNDGGPALWVYSGCPSSCVAHGPFAIGQPQDYAQFGSLGNGETRFMSLIESPVPTINVYQYNGINGITFLYSNTDGLNVTNEPEGIAQYLP